MEFEHSLQQNGATGTDEAPQHPPRASVSVTANRLQAEQVTQSAVQSLSASKPALTLCGVCETGQPKYKCPRCYLSYCSVACNKKHKENHPPDAEKSSIAKSAAVDPPSSPIHLPTDPSNPFHALDTSDKLRLLFRKYPCLGQQLLDIYAATQPPPEPVEKRIPAALMQGVLKKDTWNHDVGITRGKEALRKARRADGEAGDAVREYTELILHLINKQDDEGQITKVLQEQAAQEDSKLIEKLIAQERR
ncbi:Zinc finger, HIT-type [Moelleriella libera RCEF 2490]|uniref:Zinc finger, HIT-type n=1 Tax=Moelleriella libera RCEF 2490 TaxID=1081109 RepID=A0A167YV24_9HYPO|nr:Zinc finger, HIT-type [Moelleriella libera RCEF 2490]